MQIRNFSIIAHIDHGKSTLSDRLLEVTGTIEARQMKDQVLDSMELERERGITIKMQPVRMEYEMDAQAGKKEKVIFNLIDTPGHIDFSYEVSRSLRAVEGALMLVDATQGVQAQTITVLQMARDAGLTILPVISKVDSPLSNLPKVEAELIELLDCKLEDISYVSGKTGQGVKELLSKVYNEVPAPKIELSKSPQALIFDFAYSNHQGVIIFCRIFSGEIKAGDEMLLVGVNKKFTVNEVGVMRPVKTKTDKIEAGEIGYIVTGIKEPGITRVGDTVTLARNPSEAIEGYGEAKPLIFASIYPENADDFPLLRQSLLKLKLTDSSLGFDEESSGALGRGFRCGFLGMLHLEIITERLRREFDLDLIITSPSIPYRIIHKNDKEEIIYNPNLFPDHGNYKICYEPMVNLTIIVPADYVSIVAKLLYNYEGILGETEVFPPDRFAMKVVMPLRELMRNFFDVLKSATSGYGSVSYEPAGHRETDVRRMEILLAEEVQPAFTKVVGAKRLDEEADDMVERLYGILPREMFVIKIQAKANGKIIASRSLSAIKKDVTGYLYGGDITRKMKLREKQKKGKAKMQSMARVQVTQDTFLKVMKGGKVEERSFGEKKSQK
jgi:GTP-binding protein LepA